MTAFFFRYDALSVSINKLLFFVCVCGGTLTLHFEAGWPIRIFFSNKPENQRKEKKCISYRVKSHCYVYY